MSDIKHLSRDEMVRLLDEHHPTMSTPSRNAVLDGVPLVVDGTTYQAPEGPKNNRPTDTLHAQLIKVDDTWIN